MRGIESRGYKSVAGREARIGYFVLQVFLVRAPIVCGPIFLTTDISTVVLITNVKRKVSPYVLIREIYRDEFRPGLSFVG